MTAIELLRADQCLELLRRMPVGRIGITVGAMPVILPVSYAIIDGAITFRTVPGTKLHAATSDAVVAFETDFYESDGSSGWSVLVQGVASEVVDPAEREKTLVALPEPWGVARGADRVVKVSLEKISGRRFTQPAPG